MKINNTFFAYVCIINLIISAVCQNFYENFSL